MNRIDFSTEKHGKSFTIRLMASYSLILFVILCMGIVFYCFSTARIKQGVREQNRAAFVHSAEQIDADLRFLTTFAQQIANNSKLARLANLSSTDDRDFYILAYEVREWLSSLLPSHSMIPIDSYFIHLRNTDYILSFNKVDDLWHHYANRLLEKETYQQWKAIIEDREKQGTFISMKPFTGTYTRDPDNYYYVVSMDGFFFHSIPADVCFEVDAQKLRDVFSGLNLYTTGYILAVNGDDEIMFALSGSDGDTNVQYDGNFLRNLSYDAKGFGTYESAGETMLVTSCQSEQEKWNYYLVQPSDNTLYSVNIYQDIVIGVLTAAVLMGFSMIVLLSRRNSRPFQDMKGELNRSREMQQELLNLTRQQEPFVRNSYIRQIVQGTIRTDREMEYVREYLGFPGIGEVKYWVLYCNVYCNDNGSGPKQLECNPFVDAESDLGRAFAQYFSKLQAVCSMQEHSFALLLMAPAEENEETMQTDILRQFVELHDYLLENYSIWISGGMGSGTVQLAFAWKSYRQAREAVHYTTREQVICSYASVTPNSQIYYYPGEVASQLCGFIEAGNERQIRELFKLIQKENLEKRVLPVRQMNWLLADIRNTLLKARFDLKDEGEHKEILEIMDEKMDGLPSLKLWEDMAVELGKLWGMNASENQLINRIRRYIAENYSDPSLCLTKISEEFAISECYFSYLFKKTTGENFSAYLEHLRMEKAMEMLKTTNVKISQMFIQLGYNNITSFRRAFKKNYGVSPNHIREGMQPAEEKG